MFATPDQLEFAPPRSPGLVRAGGLAVLAHGLLLIALTWGVSWRSTPLTQVSEAELWSTVPQAAAPKVETPSPDPIPPPVAPAEPPRPAQPLRPPPPQPSDATIALEREKQQALEKQKAQAQRLEQLKLEQLKQAKLAHEKDLLEKKKLKEQREREEKVALQKKLLAQALERKALQDAKVEAEKIELQRQANLKRMAGLAEATGASTATGQQLQSSGQSAGYAQRVQAKIRPNIVYIHNDINAKTVAEVEVRTGPGGTITSRKLLKSSGVVAWDEAVLRAIDKTGTLPRDQDGTVPSLMLITFGPQ